MEKKPAIDEMRFMLFGWLKGHIDVTQFVKRRIRKKACLEIRRTLPVKRENLVSLPVTHTYTYI